MSNQIDPFSNSLNIETIHRIDQLNLSIIQKHHLRILTHCLVILQALFEENNTSYHQESLLKDWCYNQSQKFNDAKFNDDFYNQLASSAKKLHNFAQSLEKNIQDLDMEDLVLLVKKS